MEERRSWEESTSNVLKVVVIILFFIGAAIFGKKVWAIEFEDAWKSWLAIVLGEISFLYSFVFVVAGIWIICAYFRNREDNDWGLNCGLICLCLAAIFQLVFWGGLVAYSNAFKIAGVLAVVTIFLACWLRKSCVE